MLSPSNCHALKVFWTAPFGQILSAESRAQGQGVGRFLNSQRELRPRLLSGPTLAQQASRTSRSKIYKRQHAEYQNSKSQIGRYRQ
jgi:hypothetical protein